MVTKAILKVLETALKHDGEIPLIDVGKGRDKKKGLFSKHSPTNDKVINACLDPGRPLLIVREVSEAGGTHDYVELGDHGLAEILHAHEDDPGSVLDQAAPRYKSRLAETRIDNVRQRFEELGKKQAAIRETQQGLMKEVVQFFTSILESRECESAAIERDRHQMGDELARLRELLKAAPATVQKVEVEAPAPKPPKGTPDVGAADRTKSQREPSSETDLDFQRDLARELVIAWQDAGNDAARGLLEQALFNVGVEPIGNHGIQVAFDGRWHDTDDDVEPGDSVEVIEPGWRLTNRRGSMLLTRAKVKMPHHPHVAQR